MDTKQLIKIVFIFILLLIVFSPVYHALFERFTAADTYYSHGFLVPFVSGYLVWRKRRKLKAIPRRSEILGLPFNPNFSLEKFVLRTAPSFERAGLTPPFISTQEFLLMRNKGLPSAKFAFASSWYSVALYNSNIFNEL